MTDCDCFDHKTNMIGFEYYGKQGIGYTFRTLYKDKPFSPEFFFGCVGWSSDDYRILLDCEMDASARSWLLTTH